MSDQYAPHTAAEDGLGTALLLLQHRGNAEFCIQYGKSNNNNRIWLQLDKWRKTREEEPVSSLTGGMAAGAHKQQ